MSKGNYLLQVGDEDFKRMNALSNIYMAYNTKFIMENGLKEGISVADVGCGPGFVSLWLADKVGLKGNVTAIDASVEQLTILEREISKQNIKNIKIKKHDIYQLSQINKKFDLIFCRLILGHLTNPILAVQELSKCLKLNGKLIISELDNQTWFSYPDNPYLKKEIELTCRAGKINGSEFTIGKKLFSLFNKAEFKDIYIEIAQPVLHNKEQREALILKAKYWGNIYLKNKLISEEERIELVNNIEILCNDYNSIIAGAQMFQVCGRKAHAD